MQSHLQFQKTQAERVAQYDCECFGCPDLPMRCRDRFCLTGLVVLSFLDSELGYDFGCTWPRDTKSSFPETELSCGAVQVASLAFQTSAVTNK